ncbi:MAG: hypothetical protein M3348_11180, partial [Acidobacteriota bacterium]|nr:hypothetical protein [Acidobacteriota bacterium]
MKSAAKSTTPRPTVPPRAGAAHAAPPAPRPQPAPKLLHAPKVLQRKAAPAPPPAGARKSAPATPPAYRPHKASGVLQPSASSVTLVRGGLASAGPASRKQNAPAGASRSCIQLYSVTVFQGNVDDEILQEVRRLVKAAEDAGGGKSAQHDVLDKLQTNVTTLASQGKEYDPGTQNTWGVGGLKSGNGVYQVTVGKGAWADALGTKDHLGTRESTCHAEMTIVEERPGVQAIY